jgi:FkbM family methyltransferase
MRALREILRDNSPSTKPELWSSVPTALRRRLGVHVQGWLDPGWWQRPCITTLSPGDDVLMEVIPAENHGKALLYYGMLEYAPTKLVRAFLKAGDTFVDVGANIGYYSLLAARIVGDTGKVVAFEPVDRLRARLERSVALNGFRNVTARAEIVDRTDGMVDLFEVNEGTNEGISSTVKPPPNARRVAHAAVSLDQVFADAGTRPALMKVDVEGGEEAVFAGARRLLGGEDAPCLLFESFAPERDHATLEALGYRIHVPGLNARGEVVLRSVAHGTTAYRRWEAPNFFAVKGPRGLEFARTLGAE